MFTKQQYLLTLKSFGIRTGPGPRGPPGYRGDINGCKKKEHLKYKEDLEDMKVRITSMILIYYTHVLFNGHHSIIVSNTLNQVFNSYTKLLLSQFVCRL